MYLNQLLIHHSVCIKERLGEKHVYLSIWLVSISRTLIPWLYANSLIQPSKITVWKRKGKKAIIRNQRISKLGEKSVLLYVY